MNIKNYFQIGDIVVESRDNTPIGKYIIVDVEKVNNKLTFSLYVLWTTMHWPETQGSIFTIDNLHYVANKARSSYTWTKLR